MSNAETSGERPEIDKKAENSPRLKLSEAERGAIAMEAERALEGVAVGIESVLGKMQKQSIETSKYITDTAAKADAESRLPNRSQDSSAESAQKLKAEMVDAVVKMGGSLVEAAPGTLAGIPARLRALKAPFRTAASKDYASASEAGSGLGGVEQQILEAIGDVKVTDMDNWTHQKYQEAYSTMEGQVNKAVALRGETYDAFSRSDDRSADTVRFDSTAARVYEFNLLRVRDTVLEKVGEWKRDSSEDVYKLSAYRAEVQKIIRGLSDYRLEAGS